MKIQIRGLFNNSDVVNSMIVDYGELGVTEKTWLALNQDQRLELIQEFWDNSCHLEVGYKEVVV